MTIKQEMADIKIIKMRLAKCQEELNKYVKKSK